MNVMNIEPNERKSRGRRLRGGRNTSGNPAISCYDIPLYPKGTPVPTPTVEVQVLEMRVDLSNDMTWRQMIGVGVRMWSLCARGAR